MSSFKAQVAQYPPLLKKSLIEKYLAEALYTVKVCKSGAAHGDIFHVTGCLFRCIACLVQVIFALNEQYFVNEKGSILIADSFLIRPDRFKERIDDIMSNPGKSRDELLQSIQKIELLTEEVRGVRGGEQLKHHSQMERCFIV